jgi:hypothetical protein
MPIPSLVHTGTREPGLSFVVSAGGGQLDGKMVSANGTAQADAVSSAAMLDAAAWSSLAAQGFAGGGESAKMAQTERGGENCASHS